MRRAVDSRVESKLVGLLRVERQMFQQRHDAGRLSARDHFAAQDSGDVRVFREVFEVAAVVNVAHEIDSAAEMHVEAALFGFLSEGDTYLTGGGFVERGSHEQPGGERRAAVERSVRVAAPV